MQKSAAHDREPERCGQVSKLRRAQHWADPLAGQCGRHGGRPSFESGLVQLPHRINA